MQTDRCLFAWLSTGARFQCSLNMHFETVVVAREVTKSIKESCNAHGLRCWVGRYGVNEWTGEYEVSLVFDEEVGYDDIRQELKKPPCYNMGVTCNE